MLKHGAEHHTGIQDAIIRNLEACEQLTKITRTSLGPNGKCLASTRVRRATALSLQSHILLGYRRATSSTCAF